MKKIITIFIVVATFTACKKKEEPVPEPAQPAPIVYLFSVKVDNIEKNCSSNCYSSIYSGGFRDFILNLSSSTEQIIFSWSKMPKPGEYTLIKYGEPSVKYSKGSYIYAASKGTLIISSIDTAANGRLSKFTANFSLKTDTLKGLFFDISSGTVDIK